MMKQTEREFLEELRRDFVLEAEEYLQVIVSGLLDLEKGPFSQHTVEEVFRAAHSLKGAAQAVQMPGISALCQVVESVFSGMKKGVFHIAGSDYDTLQRAADVLSSMVTGDENSDDQAGTVLKELEEILLKDKESSYPSSSLPPTGSSEENKFFSDVESEEEKTFRTENNYDMIDISPPEPAVSDSFRTLVEKRSVQDTVRISGAKLDDLLLKAEELISVNLALGVRLEEVRELRFLLSEWGREWEKTLALSRKFAKEHELPPRVKDFFHEGRNHLRTMNEIAGDLEKNLQIDRRSSGCLVGNLLEGTKTVLMLPFSTLFQGFPKIVRDLARDLGKKVDFTVYGGDIEVDKRILEGLKDPLVHLVRNALDHGLESPEERIAKGKSASGAVSLSVSSVDGGRVEVILSDDGKGIDPAQVRESAVKGGVLSREEALALDDPAALMLIFQSGVSTSPIITDISGRGLGMAIVREGVESLGGKIFVNSAPGKGTVFRLSLPLTLATFRGILVEEWGRSFVIPTANVEKVTRVEKEEIKKVEHRETAILGGSPLALVRLGRVLELLSPVAVEEKDNVPIVVVSSGAVTIAFAVDHVVDEQEVLLKSLGKQLQRVRNVAGVTVLGSGKVVPVLNCSDLVKSARKGATAPFISLSEEGKEQKTILVVEDSITSRTLLTNVLTAAGYDVHTAVDGAEAWEILSRDGGHIIVSDVEMPRMNGFELTKKIRSDGRFADLPVVLVTSLESREDRERGVEAGADAYIVKSGFDQGTLLEVIRRLL